MAAELLLASGGQKINPNTRLQLNQVRMDMLRLDPNITVLMHHVTMQLMSRDISKNFVNINNVVCQVMHKDLSSLHVDIHYAQLSVLRSTDV